MSRLAGCVLMGKGVFMGGVCLDGRGMSQCLDWWVCFDGWGVS